MSIIHDALKKVQNKTPPEVEILPPEQNEEKRTAPYFSQKNRALSPIKSVLTLLCAIVIILGSLGFLYNQGHTYFPKVKKLAKAPENFVPLAKLTVKPPNPPVPIKLPAISNTPKTNTPVTLNIHGVMSNGPNNVALINDQVYQEGDEVGGAKIEKINLNSITVNINGTEKTILVKN